MSFDPRTEIIDEMLAMYLTKVPERMLKGYLRHLRDIETDTLRAAVAGCIEQGQSGRRPTPFDIRERAKDLKQRRSNFDHEEASKPSYRECRKAIYSTVFGRLLCCREEGHDGQCEAWFRASGSRSEDQEIIQALLGGRRHTRESREFKELIDSDQIPF